MKYSRQFVLVVLGVLLAMPLSSEIAGFAGPDDDRDGLPDDFEQAILDKFRPTWRISATDCNGLPAEFVPNVTTPTVRAQNGTIYGQVFIRGESSLGFFVEAHFYDLWAEDCGLLGHQLDAEHVSVLIRVPDRSQPLSEWHATQWYSSAHEDTLCDAGEFAPASLVGAEDRGLTFWIARGKHSAFFSQQACSIGGCGLDRCETSTTPLSSTAINLGELAVPLNGAVWTSSNQWPLAAKMRTDFPTLSTFASFSYSLREHGGMSVTTTGLPLSTVIGYASIETNGGTASPAATSIFGVRKNNVLVTEAGVPAAPLMNSGRLYAEVAGPVNTGLAIVNPNSVAAQITFYFTDANGQSLGQNTTSIPPRGLLGKFLNEPPFNGGAIRGTFTFTSSVPVSAIAIRGYTNERNEFLITTLPVSDLSQPVDRKLIFPQVADGEGWTTQFVLVNPTDAFISGTIEFSGQGTVDTPATALELSIDGQTGSTFVYGIPPRSSWVGRTTGVNANVRVGSARVTPSAFDSAPVGVAVFSFKRSGIVVSESGTAAVGAGSAFQLFTELSGNFNNAEAGSLQTGIAIANPEQTATAVNLELTNLNGAPVGTPGTVVVPGKGQVAVFLNQLPGFSSLAAPFQGVLRAATSSGTIAVIGLRGRYNERRDFLMATIAAVNENSVGHSGDTFFLPYFADGGDPRYTTQFILFSSSDGQLVASSGWLRFYSLVGAPLNLSLR